MRTTVEAHSAIANTADVSEATRRRSKRGPKVINSEQCSTAWGDRKPRICWRKFGITIESHEYYN